MTQIELNQKFAKAYGCKAFRLELVSITAMHTETKMVEIHEDTLTLFQLCIERGVNVLFDTENNRVCTYFDGAAGVGYYKNHATKEAVTCSAMWAALSKLKNIGSE